MTDIEFTGMSVLGLPLEPAERVRDATALATALLAEAARALPQDADPGMASAIRYALMMTQRAAEKVQGVSAGG